MKANRLAPKKGLTLASSQSIEPVPPVVTACCAALRLTADDLLGWALRPGEVVLVLTSGIKVRMAADTERTA